MINCCEVLPENKILKYLYTDRGGGAVGRAFTLNADGLVFESKSGQTKVMKSGSDSSTAKRSAAGVHVNVTGPRR